MKIGVITNLYPPIIRGGAERVVQRIVRGLCSRGYDVFVISTRPRDLSMWKISLPASEVQKVYRFFPRNIYHLLSDYKYPFLIRIIWHLIDLLYRWNGKYVANILKQEKPDIIFTHNLKGISLTIPNEIRKLKIPFVHTLHDVQLSVPSGLLIHGSNSWLTKGFARNLYEHMVKKAMGSPDVVISPSNFLANFYKDRGFFQSSKWQIISSPAPEFRISEEKTRQHGTLRLLFAGQLEKHKGILMLLRVLHKLDTNISVELHIAGEGTLSEVVRERTGRDNRIIFHGFVSNEGLQNLFNMTDAIIVPSLCYENSPTIIFESFQAGMPVIASNIGGVGELVEDGKNGFLFEPGSEEGLELAILKMSKEIDRFWARRDEIKKSVSSNDTNDYFNALKKIIDELSR